MNNKRVKPNNKRVKPIIIEPKESPYRHITRVICPKCNELLLSYYRQDSRIPNENGDPLDKYNYCRNCGLYIDMSGFKFFHYVS